MFDTGLHKEPVPPFEVENGIGVQEGGVSIRTDLTARQLIRLLEPEHQSEVPGERLDPPGMATEGAAAGEPGDRSSRGKWQQDQRQCEDDIAVHELVPQYRWRGKHTRPVWAIRLTISAVRAPRAFLFYITT